ncbi:type II toxin-antitoxin system VapC family toxin [Bacteroidota bacterium]
MVKRQSIYLDTSVINFLFADDSPERKEITQDFFDNFIKTGIYECYISGFVIDEIENTTNKDKREKLLKIIEECPIDFIEISDADEIEDLAKVYVDKGIIPYKKYYDAYHIACAVANKIDYLISWNFRHLANIKRERKVISANLDIGYVHEFRIITPLELMDYEN